MLDDNAAVWFELDRPLLALEGLVLEGYSSDQNDSIITTALRFKTGNFLFSAF